MDDDTVPAACEPPEPGAVGRRVSPSSNRIFSGASPSASAETCVITV